MDVTDFLLARIAEDEAVATAAGHGCGYLHEHNAGWVEVDLPSEHNARPSYEIRYLRHFDPNHVRAECEAKRRIVERHQRNRTEYPPRFDEFDPHWITVCAECGTSRGRYYPPCATLRDLAAIYAEHPDYREEWRP